jgi:predicted component of type VI protein secretion system
MPRRQVQAMPPQLVALTDGPNILLDKPILLLGRHQECDIQLGSRKVSRRHCCVAQVSDYLVVRDLGSTNGIRINGTRVLEGSLHTGDELTIGNQRFSVQMNAAAKAGDPLPSLGPRPAPAGPAASAAPPGAESEEDDPLESCDNPVALSDSGRAPVQPPSGLVPDDIRLMPLSGEHGPAAK